MQIEKGMSKNDLIRNEQMEGKKVSYKLKRMDG